MWVCNRITELGSLYGSCSLLGAPSPKKLVAKREEMAGGVDLLQYSGFVILVVAVDFAVHEEVPHYQGNFDTH